MRDTHADPHADPHGDSVDQANADADANYGQANAVAYPRGHADPHRIN